MAKFIIRRASASATKPPASPERRKAAPKRRSKNKAGAKGRVVFFKTAEGMTLAGVVVEEQRGRYNVKLAIPNGNGILVASGVEVQVDKDSATFVDAPCKQGGDVRMWDDSRPLEGVKAAREVKDDNGHVVDYVDVEFEGYGSTFESTTPQDRDGDYILPGAFDRSLREFKANPVMLTDHRRSVYNLVGSYSKVSVNQRGLALRGKMSNAPDIRRERFLVMEGHLKTLSIGGVFFYLPDGRGIEEIMLYETSLVVVPANPDATFQVRSLNEATAGKAIEYRQRSMGGEIRFR